ncbi:hypothetical protein DL93DRAFT_103331 [Clavulina sp. PMI_390]|nr:hypothetical protein DL93DRAFT_103331 [Clavulina sp. PMI_390]
MHTAINALPNELFLLVIEHLLLSATDSAQGMVTSLLTITSISTRWREVAIGHSPFWATIYFKLSKPPTFRRRNNPRLSTQLLTTDLGRVRCFLERSKKSPINIHIPRSWENLEVLPEDKRSAIEENWTVANDLLGPHVGRCRSISVHFSGVEGPSELSRLLRPWKFPLLQVLTIQNWAQQQDHMTVRDPTWSYSPEHTPLRALKFSDPWNYLPKNIDVSWPLLASIELNIAAQFWPNVCDTLALLPTLQELRIAFSVTTVRDAISSAPRRPHITLPLVEHVATNLIAIWYDVCTPSLRSVTFTSNELYYSPYPTYRGQDDLLFVGLLQLLAEMPIRDVTFSSCFIKHDLILSILQAFAHMESLSFYGSRGHGKLLNSVSYALERRAAEHSPDSRAITNVNSSHKSTLSDVPFTFLKKVFVEEPQTQYSILWDFPHIWSVPPHSFVHPKKQKAITNGTLKKGIVCDQCRKALIRCDGLSQPGGSCTQCMKRARDCTFNTNTGVMEAREMQKAVNRLQALGLEVTWVLK